MLQDVLEELSVLSRHRRLARQNHKVAGVESTLASAGRRQWREFEMTRSMTTPGASARGLDVQGARPPDPPTPQCPFPPDAKPGLDAAPASSLDTEQVFEVLISAPLNSDEFEAALDRLFADESL